MPYGRKRLSAKQAAARLFELYSANLGKTFHIRQVAKRTNMSIDQVRNGERFLKAFLNEHRDEIPKWTLHISLSNVSAHGLISDGDKSFIDAVSRLLYMASRSTSELDYREQQMARVQDPIARKHLGRGITYQRAAREAFADAYERLSGK